MARPKLKPSDRHRNPGFSAFDDDTWDRLVAAAQEDGLAVSAWIRLAVKRRLAAYEQHAPITKEAKLIKNR